MLLPNLCLLCGWLNSPQCLQCNDAISITTQCALARFSILLNIGIELTSSFKTSLRLYILLTGCKCYYGAKSLGSQSNCGMPSFAILSDAALTLKPFPREFFLKKFRACLIKSMLSIFCKNSAIIAASVACETGE